MNISDKLHTSVFHKVDDLPFSVISLTFPDSLIPYHMGSNFFATEVLRFLRICSHADFVFVTTRKTAEVLIERDYNEIDFFKSVSNKHIHLMLKLNVFSVKEFYFKCNFM